MDNNPNELLNELAATLDGHQITDGEGKTDETDNIQEDTAASEAQTTEDEPATAEKPAETPKSDSQADKEGSETELAEDESGKRYVPESRFKEIYALAKAAERKAENYERMLATAPAQQAKGRAAKTQEPDKVEVLETEILKGKLPQFDPDSSDYSPELDKLGGEIYKGNPGITRIEAAKRAVDIAKQLSSKVAEEKIVSRTVKSLQSDQGITNRVTTRTSAQPDVESMSDREMENYLKEHGMW